MPNQQTCLTNKQASPTTVKLPLQTSLSSKIFLFSAPATIRRQAAKSSSFPTRSPLINDQSRTLDSPFHLPLPPNSASSFNSYSSSSSSRFFITDRMRKRRCFADKELEAVMMEREQNALLEIQRFKMASSMLQVRSGDVTGQVR